MGHSLMSCTCTVNVCESEVTFANWTTMVWVSNRVGAVDRRALFFIAKYIPTLNTDAAKEQSKVLNMKNVH